jgi:hypothetical protein
LELEGEVAQVYEAVVSAAARQEGARVSVSHAAQVDQPLAATRKKRKRLSAESSDTSASSAEADSADEEADRIRRAGLGSSSDSSCPSVDTDAPGVDEVLPSAAARVPEPGAKLPGVDSASEDEEDDQADPIDSDLGAWKATRHPPGTWKVWESTWFYATKTPGYIDLKCWIKSPLRNVYPGMGVYDMSKTLTPYHYGDEWENPWRTLLLLRAWSLWRARVYGWAQQKECRQREVARQAARFAADLRAACGERPTVPLLGSAAAHSLLVRWVGTEVSSIVGSSAPV